MEQSLWYFPGQAACFTVLWLHVWGGVKEGKMPLLPDSWGLAWHLPHFQSLHPLPICDCCPSSCCPDCPRVGGFVYVPGSPAKSAVLSATLTPTGFYSQKIRSFIFPWCWNPELLSLAWCWDCTLQRCPSDFYPPYVNVEPSVLLATTATSSVPAHCMFSTMALCLSPS